MNPETNPETTCTGHRADHDAQEPLTGNYFVATYPPFSTWTPEAVSAVTRVLNQPPPPPADSSFGLYVHIPFCVERCRYCYYLSHAGRSRRDMDQYADALIDELRLHRDTPYLANRPVRFVYFGGGTPSLLPDETLARLLNRMQAIAPWDDAEEVCFETAPKTTTPSKMRLLHEHGVTRLSLGIQSFNDDVLRRNGRLHLAADIDKAYAAVRNAGFSLVNLDLIVGLVGESEASFLHSVERVINLAPESVTIYQLEIPPYTPLCHDLHANGDNLALLAWPEKRRRLDRAFARLGQAGYTLRSAYTAVRNPEKHAFIYQDAQYAGADFLGLGLASFSYLGGVHFQNIASDETYLDHVARRHPPIQRAFALNNEHRMVREFVLQLKLGSVNVARLRHRYGADPLERFAAPLNEMRRNGWIRTDANSVTLTRPGLLRVDRCLSMFYPPDHRAAKYA